MSDGQQEKYNEETMNTIMTAMTMAWDKGADFKDFEIQFEPETCEFVMSVRWKEF